MGLEVKQLVVQGNVMSDDDNEASESATQEDLDAMKEEILEECRRLVAELLRVARER